MIRTLPQAEHPYPTPAARPSTAAITIQSGQTGATPVFCIHGAGANVACFLPLAQALGSTVPMIGLQARGHDGKSAPHASVAAAALDYLRDIREIAPQGPYRVLGHSFGGWIAFEIARRLAREGEVLEPVIVLDSTAPSSSNSPARRFEHIDTLVKFIELLEMGNDRSLDLSRSHLQALSPQAQLDCLLKRMVAIRVLSPRSTTSTLRNLLRVFCTNLNTSYVPEGPYFGKMLLVSAADQSPHQDDPARPEPDRSPDAWRLHAPNLVALSLPGNHMTMLKPLHVLELARQISQVWPGIGEKAK